MARYDEFDAARASGDFSSLPELHASLAGMKALSTWITSDGAEAARRCCGGHGYSQLSGLPGVFASYVQNVTWEGDNNVMCLQTARFLLKAVYSGRVRLGLFLSAAGLSGERKERKKERRKKKTHFFPNLFPLSTTKHTGGAESGQARENGGPCGLRRRSRRQETRKPAENADQLPGRHRRRRRRAAPRASRGRRLLRRRQARGGLQPPTAAVRGSRVERLHRRPDRGGEGSLCGGAGRGVRRGG